MSLSIKQSVRITVCILTVLTVLFSGCRPRGILHSGEMRRVLVDLHKTDALMQVNGLQYGHDEAENIYYAQVLEKHGITQAQFDSSIVWYTAHPLLFDKIYPKVKDQIRAERKAYQEKYADELNLMPGKSGEKEEQIEEPVFTVNDLEKMIWISRNGIPHTWNEWHRSYNLFR